MEIKDIHFVLEIVWKAFQRKKLSLSVANKNKWYGAET